MKSSMFYVLRDDGVDPVLCLVRRSSLFYVWLRDTRKLDEGWKHPSSVSVSFLFSLSNPFLLCSTSQQTLNPATPTLAASARWSSHCPWPMCAHNQCPNLLRSRLIPAEAHLTPQPTPHPLPVRLRVAPEKGSIEEICMAYVCVQGKQATLA